MLDEQEYRQVFAQLDKGTEGDLRERKFSAIRNEYERITGYHESNHNAIFHHRLDLYGPPCAKCGKPLRTPQAKLCGACMHPVARS